MKQTGYRYLLGPVAIAVEEFQAGIGRDSTPVLDTDMCTGCGQCQEYCPCGAIVKVNKQINILYSFCKGCLICREMCKSGAITEKEEITI